jgi:hypothetical protein
MKKECMHTRKSLAKYLSGHLFKLEQTRIERHLRSCVVCYSQYQALKRVDETRKYLKDITPPEGVVQRMKEGVSGLAKLKKVLYRPLWIAGIIVVAALVIYYLRTPRQLDVELDNIVKTVPSGTASAAGHPIVAAAPPAAAPSAAPAPSPARAVEPLAILITTADDTAATSRINEVMRGHGRLREMRFSDTVRELSGSLTAKELLTFFNRIESAAKVSYSRKRLESFPAGQPVPFVMKLRVAPRTAEGKAPIAPPVKKSAEAEAPPAESSGKPVEAAAPALPATAPTSSAAR